MPPLGFELSALYFEDISKGLKKKEGRLNVDHKKPLCIYTYVEKSPVSRRKACLTILQLTLHHIHLSIKSESIL